MAGVYGMRQQDARIPMAPLKGPDSIRQDSVFSF